MVTSMLQYLLLAPSYINLLSCFAFCNLHDLSWGTKEQTTSEIDLGITRKINKNEVDMALPADQSDIGTSCSMRLKTMHVTLMTFSTDVVYDRSLHNLKTRPMIIPPQLTASQRREAVMDHYQSIRTNILLAWVLTNAVLVCTILNGDYSSTFAKGSGTSRAKVCEFPA